MQPPAQTLVLFAREPVPGRVKTRLASLLTAEGASRLYRAFLEDASRVYADPAWTSVVDAEADPGASELAILFPPPWRRETQGPGDLGARLTAAFDREGALGAAVTVAVGSDHPALPRRALRSLFERVAGGRDAALIPARDGGSCAIALSTAVDPAAVFRDVPWSTPATLATTLDRMREAGLSVAVDPAGYDVDRPEDLDRLRRDLAERDPAEDDYPRATSAALALLPGGILA
ncbi:MAG TPA: TIGR04282 family arsenosugar biosynthesis glycosyltransferase [Thermoanaerobaculia bacterium]|nr:TIGR04282 family arsenosugar biosynthesis glycosyltransferase [Thermoanaerobaculia bacterium]